MPFLPGYRWHRTARIWRTPRARGDGDGRRPCGFTLKWLSREANVTPGPLPEDMRRSIIDHFDQGTERAILRLYRSSPPERLAAAGAHLGDVGPDAGGVGHARPLHPRALRREYAVRSQRRAARAPDAGHWPWLDRPDLPARVHEFLARG